jgi:isopentenyldiphosphate isomerase
MSYYDEKQYLAEVDRNDIIIRKTEKWEAHKNSILHRGYTALIRYGEELALQHRKHPVFDNVLDLSFSSHQIYKGDTLQTDEEAIYEGLQREWGMQRSDLAAAPRFVKKVYYQAKDEKSGYFEHEIDYIFEVKTLKVPVALPEFAYGAHLVKPDALAAASDRLRIPFAPWVKALLEAHIV